jgi:predicted Zn-dependent peptidase
MARKKSKDNPLAEIRELSDGGRLAIEHMPSMESFTLGFFLPVGAAHENEEQSGVSHFIEHMLFKGSKKRSAKAIVKAVERVGGIINASTGREVTYFYIRVSAKRLDLAFDVLTDLVFNPEFDRKALEREKGVILEEINMNEDDPGQALYDRFLMSIHGNTAYGRPILGSRENILSFNRKALVDYHRSHYAPSRLVASIAGGIDPDRATDHLEKCLARFSGFRPDKFRSPRQPRFRASVGVWPKDVEQSELVIGFPSASIKSPKRYAYSLLDAIMAGGMMSRLFQEIREKRGLVYSIDSTHQPYSKGGLFTIEAGMREENLMTVLALVLREIKRLIDEGPGKRELEDAKLFLRGHWALGLESTSARMIRNAMSTLFFGRLLKHNEVVGKLKSITADDLCEAAARAFENGGPAVGALSRFQNGDLLDQAEEQIQQIREKQGITNNRVSK